MDGTAPPTAPAVPSTPSIRAVPTFAELSRDLIAALPESAERVTLAPGEILFRQDDPGDALYLVLDGMLEAVTGGADDGEALLLGTISPGEPVGEVQFLTGGRRTATVRAAEPSTVAVVGVAAFEHLAERVPDVVEGLTGVVRQRMRRNQLAAALRPLFGEVSGELLDTVEAEVDWVYLRRGERLFAQGDASDGIYVVVGGRLRAVLEDASGVTRALGEVAAGESTGEMSFFTGEPRTAAMYAVRDTVLVRFEDHEFERVIRDHPTVGFNVTRLVVERMRWALRPQGPSPISNVAVVGATPGAPVAEVARKLAEALGAFGGALHLDRAGVEDRLGTPGIADARDDHPQAPRLLAWLDEQEAHHRFLVLEGDAEATAWTGRCIRHADHVVVLADPAASPEPGPVEEAFLRPAEGAKTARRMLVLLHPEDADLPTGTGEWLSPRTVDAHLHLRGRGTGEIARLARFMAGRAVGLVLGGGGARGFAHVGIVRALREAGVPVDLVGGTSMGASMAAQCAMEWRHDEMLRRNRRAFVDLRAHKEYTLPILSLVRGRKARYMGEMLYGEVTIEDLWVPFFCVSANLTRAEARIHRRGLLRLATTASASLPGVITPVVDGGELLVDGGLMNNVPADVMRQEGAGVVIVAEVSGDEPLSVTCEEFPSPWQVLGGKLFRRPVPRVPHIMEVLLRTTLLASIARSQVTRGEADYYLQPPLEGIGLMEFEALERAAEIGYRYTAAEVKRWLVDTPPWEGGPLPPRP